MGSSPLQGLPFPAQTWLSALSVLSKLHLQVAHSELRVLAVPYDRSRPERPTGQESPCQVQVGAQPELSFVGGAPRLPADVWPDTLTILPGQARFLVAAHKLRHCSLQLDTLTSVWAAARTTLSGTSRSLLQHKQAPGRKRSGSKSGTTFTRTISPWQTTRSTTGWA